MLINQLDAAPIGVGAARRFTLSENALAAMIGVAVEATHIRDQADATPRGRQVDDTPHKSAMNPA